MDRLHLRPKLPIRSVLPRYTPARSVFFCLSIRINDGNDAAFALALGGSGFAPTAAALPRPAGFEQNSADGPSADFGQTIRSGAKCMAQGHERPGRRAIAFTLRSAASFGEDAVALGHSIGRSRATTVRWHDGCEAMLVEAGDQLRDGIAGAAASRKGRCAVALPSSNSEQSLGTSNMAGRFSL